ncbi:hypothetical protein FRC17_001949 [Serendipita sp. 399]|nr:hypothetical protein FRC17_001949 [Serendipita sp. 399]
MPPSNSRKKTSERFPAGYGDFVLKSSDGVLFHFSRHILAYMSDFFRGMFELPATAKNQGTEANPLVLAETAAVLEMFLKQMDPKNLTPTIDHTTAIELLEMARKYQVQTILDRFQTTLRRERDQRTGLLFARPLAMLYIALQHDIEIAGKWALQQLIQCSSNLIENDEVAIPAKTFQYIHRLRKERIRKFQAYMDVIAKTTTTGRRDPMNSLDTVPFSITRCERCVTLRSELLLQLERIIEKSPNWRTFNGACALAINKKCQSCNRVKPGVIDVPRSQYARWANEMQELENNLPSSSPFPRHFEKMPPSSSKKKTSERFPAGYGDFVLKSSDGVVFHFSRSILAYMSDFFRGMFELPATEKNQGTARKPLVLTETAAAIEVFLQQIDPKNPTPTIDHDTVIELLEMARKYQVQTIFDRFQIMMRREHDQYTGLLFSRPLAVLYIAMQHDLEMVGKWALQELMQCSSRRIENDEVEIPAKTFQYIHRLRRERLRKLQAYIDVITKSNTTVDPPSVTTCARCSTLRSELLLHLERSIEKNPNWSTFNGICILAPDKKCPQCRKVKPGLIDVPKSQYAQWAKEMRDLEESLPPWPIAYLT